MFMGRQPLSLPLTLPQSESIGLFWGLDVADGIEKAKETLGENQVDSSYK